jgi:uncharacterized protein (TIGR02271 family)
MDSTAISIGQDVFTADGAKVGSIAEIQPNAFVIARGPLTPPERVVPRTAVGVIAPDGVHLRMTLAQVQSETYPARIAQAAPQPTTPPAPGPNRAAPPLRATGEPLVPPAPSVPPAPPRPPREPRDVDAAAFGASALKTPAPPAASPAMEQTIELKEERLVAHKEMRQVGEVEVRTVVEQVPGRLEVEAYSEEVVVEHVPVGQFVDERVEPWEEDGTLVVPIYEEQLVVVKRLLLKEELRVRRIGSTERRLIEEPVRRERVVVSDPAHTGLVHERYPVDEPDGPIVERHELATDPAPVDPGHAHDDEGGLGGLLKKMLNT